LKKILPKVQKAKSVYLNAKKYEKYKLAAEGSQASAIHNE